MRKKIIIGIAASLFAVAGLFGVNTMNQSANADISLSGIAVMAEAQAEAGGGGGDCSSWGYKTWNSWYSGSDGVDCGCRDREKVGSSC